VKSPFPRCRGTVEDHQKAASLDVRELTRQRVFDRPVSSVFDLTLRYPWLHTLRLDGFSLVLHLATGHIVTVPWTWKRCGFLDACIFVHPTGVAPIPSITSTTTSSAEPARASGTRQTPKSGSSSSVLRHGYGCGFEPRFAIRPRV
jgi:hypothetical protein